VGIIEQIRMALFCKIRAEQILGDTDVDYLTLDEINAVLDSVERFYVGG
jgi:hypothetical protein